MQVKVVSCTVLTNVPRRGWTGELVGMPITAYPYVSAKFLLELGRHDISRTWMSLINVTAKTVHEIDVVMI